ncbi:MAG: hypothetical protein HZB24_08395 [Desulfobacterales bacterium]|nr:hypothetical protein [Desulfobacterales bacterium]
MTGPTEDNEGETYFDCQKHQIKLRASRARCADPELYCKFRPSCLIHFQDKERARRRKQLPDDSSE